VIDTTAILDGALQVGLALLSLSFILTVFRIIRGPTLPDRVLGLDMLVAVVIGFIAVIGIKTGYALYVDIAISLGLVGFLSTVAFARFILVRGSANRDLDQSAEEFGDIALGLDQPSDDMTGRGTGQ
jgi:multicomponent Na+:H+ antiporter subunit F